MQLLKEGEALVLATPDAAADKPTTGYNVHALSPLLIGLVVPFIGLYMLDPSALRHARLVIFVCLVFLLFAATVLFVYSALNPGSIVSVTCDRNSQTLELIWQGPLSVSTRVIPFDEIGALRSRKDYDQDGYATSVAELALTSREVIVLPAGVTDAHLQHLRAAIGLV